ncbi:MAG: carbohydrate ABC transporter permease [Candidatus Humimicrobiaceae bacterium]
MYKNRNPAYLFIAPMFIFFIVFILYPLFYVVWLSFYEWNGFDKVKKFIGLANYTNMLHDPVFYTSLKNYILFAVLVVSVQMLLGFSMAYLMRRQAWYFGIYRAVIITPLTLTAVVVSYIFTQILAFDRGLLNVVLRSIGLNVFALYWLSDSNIVIFTIIGITIWTGTGFSMAVYSSALTALPKDCIEAAQIDGANTLQCMTKVVWPMLRGTHYSLTIIGIISALKIFDIIYLLTGGGPFHSSEVPATYMFFKAFKFNEEGFASAVSTLIILIALILTVVQLKFSRDKD